MRHLFIIDPPKNLLVDADTTIAFMREAQLRSGELYSCQIDALGVQDSARPFAQVSRIDVSEGEPWYSLGVREPSFLDEFDVVWMRKDPPFDMRYLYATHLLSLIPAPTLVVNDPQALRDANEKLIALRFPELCPDTLISSHIGELLDFRHRLGGEMIIKPLDGAGGEGIFHLKPDDRNVRVILETATLKETQLILAQRYIPEIRTGDKRVILVEGEPKGAVLRVPIETEHRANFHVGGSASKAVLSARDHDICSRVGPVMEQMGIIFAGLDIIGDWLTEINVTSPTGIREIYALEGVAIEKDVLDAVEVRWASRTRGR